MICRNCQAALEENSVFCSHCGQRVEEPMPNPVSQCPNCGKELAPGAVFCVGCGQQIQQVPKPVMPPVQQKKSKKIPILIGIAVALLLVAVLVVGLVFHWFIDRDPGEEITDAVENTVETGNFTVKYRASYEDFQGDVERVQGTVYVSIDRRNQDVTMQIDVEDANGHVQQTYALYDGYFTDGNNYEDVSEDISALFASEEVEMDMDEMMSLVMAQLGDVDLEMLSQLVNLDNLETCLSNYGEKLNDEAWLEEYAGLSIDKNGSVTTYAFEPNLYTFVSGSLDVFETVFQNKYQFIAVKEMLLSLRAPANHTNIRLAFEVQKERLVGLELLLGGTEEGLAEGETVKVDVAISQFGTTRIDEDLLAQLLADAQYS